MCAASGPMMGLQVDESRQLQMWAGLSGERERPGKYSTLHGPRQRGLFVFFSAGQFSLVMA